MNNQSIKLLAQLAQLETKAQTLGESTLKEGYLMGLRHATELIHVIDAGERYHAELEAIERNQ